MCDIPISDFNIQMQRETVNGSITFSTVTIKLEGTIIKITNGDITMDDQAWVDFYLIFTWNILASTFFKLILIEKQQNISASKIKKKMVQILPKMILHL